MKPAQVATHGGPMNSNYLEGLLLCQIVFPKAKVILTKESPAEYLFLLAIPRELQNMLEDEDFIGPLPLT